MSTSDPRRPLPLGLHRLSAIPLSHQRDWVARRLERTTADPALRGRYARAVVQLYSSWRPARGFGPLGFEDLHQLVTAVTDYILDEQPG